MEPLAPQDPREVGGYRLRGRLGAGGMGEVFLGFSPAGRAVAVKLVHPHLARDVAFRRRFREEVRAARAVGGAYTAPVVAAGPDDDPPWLATVFVPGPSLAEAVDAQGPLGEAVLWDLAAGLVEALQDIHACGLVHRDLKPSNVLLAMDGVRVIDFGITRALDGTALTPAGLIVGSPGYMSPEQVEGARTGQASDVFSLGCVLYFAATGAAPFAAQTLTGALYQTVHAEPELGALPGRSRKLIQACLAKRPADRPALPQLMAVIARSRPSREDRSPVVFWPGAIAGLVRAHQSQLDIAASVSQPPEPTGTAGASTLTSAGPAAARPSPQPAAPRPASAPSPGSNRRRLRVASLAAMLLTFVILVGVGLRSALSDAGPTPVAFPGLTALTNAVEFGPRAGTLSGVDANGALMQWDTASQEPAGPLIHVAGTDPLGGYGNWPETFSADHRLLAIADSSQKRGTAFSFSSAAAISVWDLKSRQKVATISLADKSLSIDGLAFNRNGSLLAATVSSEVPRYTAIMAWHVQSHALAATFGQSSSIFSYDNVAFSPDGRLIAEADEAGSVGLWSTATHRLITTLSTPHDSAPLALAFSPDGRFIATDARQVNLWNVAGHRLVRTLSVPDNDTLDFGIAVVFSPDGRVLAAADGSSVRLWTVTTGRPLGTLPGGRGGIYSIAFSPDGRSLATGPAGFTSGGSYTGAVDLWNLTGLLPRPGPARPGP